MPTSYVKTGAGAETHRCLALQFRPARSGRLWQCVPAICPWILALWAIAFFSFTFSSVSWLVQVP
jgi:hypothetical protein